MIHQQKMIKQTLSDGVFHLSDMNSDFRAHKYKNHIF